MNVGIVDLIGNSRIASHFEQMEKKEGRAEGFHIRSSACKVWKLVDHSRYQVLTFSSYLQGRMQCDLIGPSHLEIDCGVEMKFWIQPYAGDQLQCLVPPQ